MQKRLFLVMALASSLSNLYAKEKSPKVQPPSLKIGYTNVEYILGLLPEGKMIASEYASFEKQLDKQLGAKVEEFQKQAQAFQKGREAMTEEVRNKKQLELQQLQKKLEQFEVESHSKLYNKRSRLLQPVQEKIANAIEQVAKEGGYTHILNANIGGTLVVLYADEKHDISNVVLKKLGVAPDEAQDKKK